MNFLLAKISHYLKIPNITFWFGAVFCVLASLAHLTSLTHLTSLNPKSTIWSRSLLDQKKGLILGVCCLFFLQISVTHAQISISGTLYENDGVTTLGAGKTITAAIGTSTPSIHSTTTDASGNYTIEGIATSTIGSWTARSAAGDNDYWSSVTYGNGTFVAVGYSGDDRVMTSTDGITWATTTAAGDNDSWTSVTYGNGLFVAVAGLYSGTADRVMTSPDGITWTARSAAGDDDGWNSVTYGNGTFVAVACRNTDNCHSTDPTTIMYSTDGINWSTVEEDYLNGWNDVTYGNGTFVAVSYDGFYNVLLSDGALNLNNTEVSDVLIMEGKTLRSSSSIEVNGNLINRGKITNNGTTTLAGSSKNLDAQSVTSADPNIGRVVITGSYTALSTTTTDNLTIESGGSLTAPASTLSINGDYINNGSFIDGGGVTKMIGADMNIAGDLTDTSALGDIVINPNINLDWQEYAAAGDNDYWTSVTYGNGTFVAVGYCNGTTYTECVMTSPDGITWTARSAAGDNDGWSSVTYGNGTFVAVGSSGDRVMTSPDGITWTARSAAGNDDTWQSVTYGNGTFVAVGSSGDRVMTSTDGINWTTRTNEDIDQNAVAYGNGTFVAVGGYITPNNVAYSTNNGVTWTAVDTGRAEMWSDVIYANDMFVAVGGHLSGYNITTSPDGINWTPVTLSFDNVFSDVTYADGMFVAVGSYNDPIATSPDGINWTTHSVSGISENWRGSDITYSNGKIVAISGVGYGVLVASSSLPVATILNNASTSDLTISLNTSLDLSDTNISVAGDFTNSGTLTASTSEVIFNGTSAQTATGTLNASSSFNNLTIKNTSGNGTTTQSVTFGAPLGVTDTFTMEASTSAAFLANATATIENIDLQGTDGSPVWLRSTDSGVQWYLDVPSTQMNIYYVDVQDSNATSTTGGITATNSFDSGNNVNWSFITEVLWNPTDWTLYDTITIKHENIDEPLTDFPVYVDLADLSPTFWSTVSDGGGDIRVTTADNVEIPREVVFASTTLETGELHFKAPYISEVVDTSFRIWYNGTTVDYDRSGAYGTESVWGSNIPTVWHLQDDASGAQSDSGIAGNIGVPSGFDGDEAVAGKLSGQALDFDGSNDYLLDNTPSGIPSGTSARSMSMWVSIPSTQTGVVFGGYGDKINAQNFQIGSDITDGSDLRFYGWSTGDYDTSYSLTPLNNTGFHHFYVTKQSGTSDLLFYVDGVEVASTTMALNTVLNDLGLGGEVNDGSLDRWFDGSIDEFRIHEVVRSSAWIRAEYLNQSTTTDFYFLSSGTGSSTISNHDANQVDNAFSFQNKTNEPLFAFKLTPESGDATITELTLELRGAKDISTNDFSNIRLYRDLDNDAEYDATDKQIATGVMTLGNEGIRSNGQQGTLVFANDFLATTSQNYLVVADWFAPDKNSAIIFDLHPWGVLASDSNGGQAVTGSVRHIQHHRHTSGGGGVTAQIGDAPPAGDGDVGGGTNDGGEQIGDNPDFKWPTGHTGTLTNGSNAYDRVDGTHAVASSLSIHAYENVGYAVPSGNSINGIEVKFEMNSPSSQYVGVQLSWDGGSSYTANKTIGSVPSSDTIFTLGGPSDKWGRSWSPSEFTDANFEIRVLVGEAGDLNIDAIQVRVYHQATGGGAGGGGGGGI